MSTAYELAKLYYPRLWPKERIEALVAAGLLARDEAGEIIGEVYHE